MIDQLFMMLITIAVDKLECPSVFNDFISSFFEEDADKNIIDNSSNFSCTHFTKIKI